MKKVNTNLKSCATAKLQAKRLRLLAIALAALIVFSMAACGDDSGPSGGPGGGGGGGVGGDRYGRTLNITIMNDSGYTVDKITASESPAAEYDSGRINLAPGATRSFTLTRMRSEPYATVFGRGNLLTLGAELTLGELGHQSPSSSYFIEPGVTNVAYTFKGFGFTRQ